MGSDICCSSDSPNSKPKLQAHKLPSKPEVTIKLEDIFQILIETKNKKISMHDFEKIGSLGQGGYGKVYLVEEKANKQKGIRT